MAVCTNCGKKLNESSGFCINCNSRVKKAMNIKELKSKRLLTGVRLFLSLLLVICIFYITIKQFSKDEPKMDVVTVKMANQSQQHSLKNIGESSSVPQPDETNKLNSNQTTLDYIFPESDKKMLNENDMTSLTKAQLRLARNEIYARHGYVFNSKDLQNYFSSKSWYKANPSYKESLNKVELENIKFLKSREDRLE